MRRCRIQGTALYPPQNRRPTQLLSVFIFLQHGIVIQQVHSVELIQWYNFRALIIGRLKFTQSQPKHPWCKKSCDQESKKRPC